jgi:serine/threonine-protein kinase
MTPARFETIEEIFHAASGQTPEQRGAFLNTACQGDDALRSEVEQLFDCCPQIDNFIETPLAGLTLRILESGQPELLVGQTIGHYELLKRIGAGGMGEVYLARDVVAGRKAALKLLPLRFTGDPERLKRFEQEARAVVALNHPNIVTVYEVGHDNTTHYIASELIEGETVRQRLERSPLPLKEALELTFQIASALAAAHDAGIVHRDIKPENVMLRPDGYVKVLDFGIAKLTEEEQPLAGTKGETQPRAHTRLGPVVGTVTYMSPEQTRGEPVTFSSDIWSLGIVLDEMLGRDLTVNDSAHPTLPAELLQILDRMLAEKPRERYSNGRELVEDLKGVRRLVEFETYSAPRPKIGARLAVAVALIAAAGALAIYFSHRFAPASWPEKSIAVLPFENLSDNKQDSYFATGVQDEILSDLARIADLKVVSRTSTKSYSPGQLRNSRQIGEQLGVAHLLEGSVQRNDRRIRINAQLIDTRTDSHLWAQTYDCDTSDIFTIQSEIAQTIANQLQSKMSQREKAAIGEPPTTDLIAHKLYLQALALVNDATDREGELKAITLLEQAVARDPRFFRAYTALGLAHLALYEGYDHNAARLQAADSVIEKAAHLQPDAGEMHLLRAHYLSRVLRDYDQARGELELARRVLPNDPTVYFEAGAMDRRQGRWSEAIGNFNRAIQLDPRNTMYLEEIASAYASTRRYGEAAQIFRRFLAISPQDHEHRVCAASLQVQERADIRPMKSELNSWLADDPGVASKICGTLWHCAILERDLAAADRALADMPLEGSRGYLGFVVPVEWYQGYTARLFNRPEAAHAAFVATCAILERHLRETPEDGLSWSLLGRAKAMLGEKEQAIAAGQRACEIRPLSKEPLWGLQHLLFLAQIYALLDEKDLALKILSIYAGQPYFVDYGGLKLDSEWDLLRDDPRFEKILASLAPKS